MDLPQEFQMFAEKKHPLTSGLFLNIYLYYESG